MGLAGASALGLDVPRSDKGLLVILETDGCFADGIEAGMVFVNVVLADGAELPFGGVKRSGTSREMGLLAADEFVNKKLIRVAS